MYYGFFGGLIVFVIAYAFKPDTRYVYALYCVMSGSKAKLQKPCFCFEGFQTS